MTAISSLTFSQHAYIDRADRIAIIDKHVGWGQIVKETYHNSVFHCLTDTGVMLIVDERKETIITLYLIDKRVLRIMYNGNPPRYLINKVEYNTGHGWVITHRMYIKGL